MSDLLSGQISDAFQHYAFCDGKAAWILVDDQQRLVELGGEYARLGFSDLSLGEDPRLTSDLVGALLDPHEDYEVLPRVELASGIATDVHRGRLPGGGTFLLFFDVSEDASKETHLRQRGLDLGRILRGLGSEAVKRTRLGFGWEQVLDSIGKQGPVRRDRVAVIRVRLIEPYLMRDREPSDDPARAVACCETALVRVLEVLMERTGMAELDGSCAVQSWCGVALEVRDPAERALETAAILLGLFAPEDQEHASIAIGVATGPVALGKMALPGGQRLAVLGSCAKHAILLAQQAQAGQLLVDGPTAAAAVGARVVLEKHGSIESVGSVHRLR